MAAGRSPSAPGGADRDRTGDLLLAKQALSQLSYSPRQPTAVSRPLVGQGRFELPTSRLSSARSNQLSRSEEHTSELQSLMRISYAVFCLKKKKKPKQERT